ncbi:MAG: type VI secretion system tip protein VgrG [Acidobacteria bacterium]|nr:type VI secretion system tip protein VgrG [Acidobacteriota bacterium]
MARAMEIVTPLGGDVLLFHGMHAREELGRLGEFQVDLLSDPKNIINLDDILGKNVTVKLALPDDATRYFNGYVTRFSQGGTYGRYNRYVAEVRPWLWFLTRTADCRIFQEMTVPDILRAVFADEPTNDFKLELTNTYRKWTYCVQYRETDFNFVSRLMEHEGIYHYVRHTDGHNTLVLTDSATGHACAPGYETIPFIPPQELARPDLEHVSAWEFSREIQPGVYVHTDYDLERPSVGLKTQKALPRTYAPSKYEVFDYPGFYIQKPHGESYATVRIDEYGTQFETAHAATNARGLSVGSLFSLSGCPREDQNCEHLVLAASHQLEFGEYEGMPSPQGASYRCSFTAMSSQQQFRPRRTTPKPFVQGPQTAVVVGPAGDEIYTDKYGRVKVQFHWDRYGKKNESSSCWTRVSHPWAGKGWGAVSTPRIGQEVIVDFLEGDPDQPIVTGRVYNDDNQPPFGFPAGAVLSGIKSQTHKGAGFNELSMDDTAGTERVFIHGQYNMDTVVEHDQTSTIHNNRTDVVDVDDSETVGGNQKQHVVKNRKETVGGTETITITGHRSETVNGGEDVTINGARSHTVNGVQTTTISLAEAHTVGAARAHTVGAAEAITVGGAQVVSVGAAQMVNVGAIQSTNVAGAQSTKVAGARSVTVGAAQTTKVAADASTTVGGAFSATAGKTMSLKSTADFSAQSDAKGLLAAKDELVLECGSAKIIMKKDGSIEVEGKNITVNGSGKIIVSASGNLDLKGSKINQNS